jgi:hypothetical protein
MNKLLPSLVLGAGLLAASGGAVASASPAEQSIHLSLVERQVAQRLVDTGKPGLSMGDHNIVRSQILDTAGHVVGRGDIDCVLTGVGSHLGGLCTIVITLPDGQIAGEGAFGRSGASRFGAIVGGTRRYAGMRGQSVADTGGSDAHEAFTIDLSR